jgi:predicted AlkP superfamily phosphohydrolase/phosphomutase
VRTVIFGVDGLTFSVLHPLIQRGELPNFQKIAQEGCEAILESKYPPLTPPAWTALSTGLKPARHGVYDFWTYDDQLDRGVARKSHILTQRKGGKAIWNILSEYGKQVLVLNVPATYPPEVVNGIMVSGYMTPGADVDFAYPTAFKEELLLTVPNYVIDLGRTYERLKISGKVGPLVDAICDMTEERIKLLMYLLREKTWDFCYVAFIGADRLQHPLWEEVIALDPRTNRYFQMLDRALGQILEQLEPEDTLFVVSDHGFSGHSSYFDINEYLLQKGLLVMETDFEADRRKSSRAARFRRLVTRVGLRSVARKLKRSLKTTGIWGTDKFALGGLNRPALEKIDWEKTLAYVPSFSGFPSGYADIFLSPDMTDEQKAELCEDLKRQKNPKNGILLLDAIYNNEVYGTGPFALHEPHLLLLPNKGVTFRVELGNERVWEELGKSFGSHYKDGVLYAYGGPFKRGFKAPNAEIYDLVPTLLRSMGLPLPHAFDGRVLDELFVEKEQIESVPSAAESAAEGGLTRRKLQKLQEV